MKAAIVERYGPPEMVRIVEMPVPEPGDDEVLVRATATTVNSGDSRVRGLRIPGGLALLMRFSLGFGAPRQPVLGFNMAGVVEAVGRDVTRFSPGDRVAGSRGFSFGLHAEYATFGAAHALAAIPDTLGDADAVSVLFGGATAVAFFNAARLAAGESVLINGASGAVGVMAVQLARHLGAEVTAVCSSRNADLVRGLGAGRVVAYDREDALADGRRYDVVMDNHGTMPFARARHALAEGGRFLPVISENLWEIVTAARTKGVVMPRAEDGAFSTATYERVLDLAARGVVRPVTETVYRFDEIVEAHRHVDGGHKVGSVVLSLA